VPSALVKVSAVPKPPGRRVSPRLADDFVDSVTCLADDVELSEVVLCGDFSGVSLSQPEFRECQIRQAQLTGAVLRFARFVDCVISDSDLSGAILEECFLTRVEFRRCRASGLQASRGRFVDVGLFTSKLDGANFRMSEWERAEISDCDLAEADFYDAKMPGSRIVDCDLNRIELSKSRLTGSRLSGSKLEGLRGGESLRNVTIGSDQIIAAAAALFAALHIDIDDEPSQ
jgi:uncharacterized protein YjbI with pentapeptide repeats